jgi:hypothetical protein
MPRRGERKDFDARCTQGVLASKRERFNAFSLRSRRPLREISVESFHGWDKRMRRGGQSRNLARFLARVTCTWLGRISLWLNSLSV